jgi:prepilin-type N-terminal cleavage/methylation domain-containing protein
MSINPQRLRWMFYGRNSFVQAGFTLLEVAVVVFLIGLLFAIGFPSWLAFSQRQHISFAASQLQSALHRAKSEASLRSVRYAVTVCSSSSDYGRLEGIRYSVHPYAKSPYSFTTIEKVFLVKSTIKRSPLEYNLPGIEYGDCYTTYLGSFPGDGFSLGFFYLSNRQQSYVYRVGFNTLIGNVVSCSVVSLANKQCR